MEITLAKDRCRLAPAGALPAQTVQIERGIALTHEPEGARIPGQHLSVAWSRRNPDRRASRYLQQLDIDNRQEPSKALATKIAGLG